MSLCTIFTIHFKTMKNKKHYTVKQHVLLSVRIHNSLYGLVLFVTDLLWYVNDSLPNFTEVILPKLQLPPSPPRTPPPRMDQPLLPSEYIRKKKKEPVLGNFRSLFVSLVLTQIRLVPVHVVGQNWLREMQMYHVLI